MKDCTIIISDNSTKQTILKRLTTEKKLVNLKFFAWSELKKKLFFDYDDETLEYVMQCLNISLSNAKMYLDNMYFLQDIDDEKIKFLNALKSELEEHNLLIKNENFSSYLKNKKIKVYSSVLSKEQTKILQDLDYELVNEEQAYEPLIYKAKDINEEVSFVMHKIGELLGAGIDISNIKIIANKEYYNTLRKYFNIYNLPINFNAPNSLYSTSLFQEFITNYDTLELETNVMMLSEKYSNINDLITVINKSVKVNDKSKRKYFIIRDAKNSFITKDSYQKGINIYNIDDSFDDNDYVFYLGFNMGSYPECFKDDDYLSDKLKEKLGLDSSVDKNKQEKLKIKQAIHNIKNLVITYKESDKKGKCYPSILIQELDLEPQPCIFDITKSYSYTFSSLEYAKCLDLYTKYNVYKKELNVYQNNLNIAYKEYNNNFKGINKQKLKKSLNEELTLSYTSIQKYNECAFKYYVGNVLKLNIYESNFKAIIGSITHYILQLGLVKDIDIKREIISYIKNENYELNSKEMFYLSKLSEELELILKILKEQKNKTKLDKNNYEYELFVYKDTDDVKVTFQGLIDKVMYNIVDNEEVIAVVDYKTGNTKISIENVEYGLDMQLPIYLYLLKQNERFKNATIGGFYIQRVLDNVPSIIVNKTYEEQRREGLKLRGYTNERERIIALIDKDYAKESIISGMKIKKDGDFASYTKVLSKEEMDELTYQVDEQIDKVIDSILKGDFSINPKVIKNDNIACEYCPFKDICYKTKDNEVILGGEEA